MRDAIFFVASLLLSWNAASLAAAEPESVLRHLEANPQEVVLPEQLEETKEVLSSDSEEVDVETSETNRERRVSEKTKNASEYNNECIRVRKFLVIGICLLVLAFMKGMQKARRCNRKALGTRREDDLEPMIISVQHLGLGSSPNQLAEHEEVDTNEDDNSKDALDKSVDFLDKVGVTKLSKFSVGYIIASLIELLRNLSKRQAGTSTETTASATTPQLKGRLLLAAGVAALASGSFNLSALELGEMGPMITELLSNAHLGLLAAGGYDMLMSLKKIMEYSPVQHPQQEVEVVTEEKAEKPSRKKRKRHRKSTGNSHSQRKKRQKRRRQRSDSEAEDTEDEENS